MRKHIFTLMALAATLCACNKEQMIESKVTNPEIEPSAPLVFTATMEGAPESKATFDNTAECAAWEVGDQISVNGAPFYSQSAGTSSFFSKVSQEIRPSYLGTSDQGCYGNDNASNLVDDGGTSTRWCVNKDQKGFGEFWLIDVSTGYPTVLQTIKLWNANNTASYPNRVWKDIKVLGRLSSAEGNFSTIKSMNNLNLVANNSGLAGELDVNATVPYDEYRIIIYNNKGDDYMQMADMKFVVTYPDPESPYTAYFPAALYNEGQAVLPSMITETWADGRFNMPMYAESENTNLRFKNLCGVLKITVKSDQIASVKKIRVSSANKATSGEFTVNSDNAAVLVNPNAVDNTVTTVYNTAVPTTAEGTTFYVAVPAQNYQELKIDLSSDANITKSMTTKSGTNITVARNTIYPITFVNNSTPLLPAGALPGEFTVNNEGKKIHFSKGNLQAKYDGTKYTWDFAANQYDYIGVTSGNKTIDSQSSGKVVDLFVWSTSATKSNYGINNASSTAFYSGSFVDWGKNIGDGVTWRTLSKDEWVYLLKTRKMANDNTRYTIDITYGGKMGLVLYPDDYSGSTLSGTVTSLPEGVVFLPTAGSRSGVQILSEGIHGYYWSSTAMDGNNAYCLYFLSGNVSPGWYNFRFYGNSVRLVTESN